MKCRNKKRSNERNATKKKGSPQAPRRENLFVKSCTTFARESMARLRRSRRSPLGFPKRGARESNLHNPASRTLLRARAVKRNEIVPRAEMETVQGRRRRAPKPSRKLSSARDTRPPHTRVSRGRPRVRPANAVHSPDENLRSAPLEPGEQPDLGAGRRSSNG
jgi:hypothetical protein